MNRMWYISLSVSLFILSITAAQARIIHVPIDAATIQEGIDGAVDGDTVLVEPDTYLENINFNGHNIVLGSLLLTTGDTSYVSSTIISSSSWGPIVTFENGEDSTALIAGFSIQNGRAWQGGGIYCYNSSPSLTNIAVTGSEATLRGGGISCYWNSSPCLTYVSISENSAPDGGGIYCYYNSNPSLSDVVVHGNDADVGGGVYCYASNPTLSNVTISGNVASGNGGGIYTEANLSASNVTISGNVTGQHGGGIYLKDEALRLENLTIVNNTIDGEVGTGGGIAVKDGTLVIKNTLIGDNVAAKGDVDCFNWGGPFDDHGYNLVENPHESCVFEHEKDITGHHPKVDVLADNGGATWTHALMSGSAAINNGDCTDIAGFTVLVDQRGAVRPQGYTCDIGAYESSLGYSLYLPILLTK